MTGKTEPTRGGTLVRRFAASFSPRLWGLSAAVAAVLLLQAAQAQEQRTLSGKVFIEQVQIALIGSGNLGGGTLDFGGKKYPFTIGGLGIGGIGISKMTATGEVYDLKTIDAFPGAYAQGRYGAVAGDHDTGELWLQNAEGVSLHLVTEREGLALSLGADAIYIDFDD
ncbi:hypothetical protein [Pelagibius sp. 7325]|uniref:hypothetical protein n=1 Tax=Pelagibius sp. 7325 TaxID=3131994 RepID=UPI0030ED11E6